MSGLLIPGSFWGFTPPGRRGHTGLQLVQQAVAHLLTPRVQNMVVAMPLGLRRQSPGARVPKHVSSQPSHATENVKDNGKI